MPESSSKLLDSKKITNQILPIKNKTVSVGPVKDWWGGPRSTIFKICSNLFKVKLKYNKL